MAQCSIPCWRSSAKKQSIGRKKCSSGEVAASHGPRRQNFTEDGWYTPPIISSNRRRKIVQVDGLHAGQKMLHWIWEHVKGASKLQQMLALLALVSSILAVFLLTTTLVLLLASKGNLTAGLLEVEEARLRDITRWIGEREACACWGG